MLNLVKTGEKFFDIIVPTYNRFDLLPVFFSKIASLDKSKYTLWLIDDCSPKKDVTVIPAWDNIVYLPLSKNLGQAAARNVGIKRGSAPYIISLDDDSWFVEDCDVFDRIQRAFELYPDAGCLMFNVATPNSNFTKVEDGVEIALHVTCGCVYQRRAILRVNGFCDLLQGQSEEMDLSLRLLKADFKIRSLYSIRVFHNFVPSDRTMNWYLSTRFKNTRNDLAIVYMHYPFWKMSFFLPAKALSHLFFAVKHRRYVFRTILITIQAWFAFIVWVPILVRHPVSNSEFTRWYRILRSS